MEVCLMLLFGGGEEIWGVSKAIKKWGIKAKCQRKGWKVACRVLFRYNVK